MDTQSLLSNASQLPLSELESFVHQLNAVIVRKKTTDISSKDTILLDKINKTVLDKVKTQRYRALIHQMEMSTISDVEYTELLTLVEQEEKIRVKRLKYLIELAQLRNISLPQLMKNLELNNTPPSNV